MDENMEIDMDMDRDGDRDRDKVRDRDRVRDRVRVRVRVRAGKGKRTGTVIGTAVGIEWPGENTLLSAESHPTPVSTVWTYTSSFVGAKSYHSQLQQSAGKDYFYLFIIICVHCSSNKTKKL